MGTGTGMLSTAMDEGEIERFSEVCFEEFRQGRLDEAIAASPN